jgi:hypothetical protein
MRAYVCLGKRVKKKLYAVRKLLQCPKLLNTNFGDSVEGNRSLKPVPYNVLIIHERDIIYLRTNKRIICIHTLY